MNLIHFSACCVVQMDGTDRKIKRLTLAKDKPFCFFVVASVNAHNWVILRLRRNVRKILELKKKESISSPPAGYISPASSIFLSVPLFLPFL